MLKKNKFKALIIRFMRIMFVYTVSVVFFIQFATAAHSYGQQTLKQNLSINAENETLEETLSKISKVAHIKFVYSTNTISLEEKVSYDFSNESLKDILDKLLLPYSINYVARKDGYIVLVPLKSDTPKQQPRDSVKDETNRQTEGMIKVHGVVYNENGTEVLPGANVLLKENMRGTVTNENGEFTLWGRKNWHLMVSFIGFKTTVVPLDGRSELKIQLKANINTIDEITVASNGYQKIPKERSTGSITTIGADELKESPSANPLLSLESKIPGVQISVLSGDRTFTYNNTLKTPNSGTHTVGATDYNVTIRGQGTLMGEKFPLLVVDGAISEMDISAINPDDIESITILKDASAASIWGVRAANGVIVITTKKGKSNQAPQINFSTNIMVADKPDLSYIKTMNSAQMLDYEKELVDRGVLYKNDASTYYGAQSILSKGSNLALQLNSGDITQSEYDSQVAKLSQIDSRKQISKYLLQRASRQNYNISVSGGAKKSNYYYSASYTKENPNTVRDMGKRYTITLNNSWELFGNIVLSTNFKGTFFEYNSNGISLNSLYKPQSTTLLPYDLLADQSGNGVVYNRYDPTWVSNLGPGYRDWTYNYLDELRNNDNQQKTDNYVANINLRVPLFKGLTASAMYSKEKSNSTVTRYYNQDTYYFRDIVNFYTYPGAGMNSLGITTGGILSKVQGYENNYSLRGQLDFNRRFNKVHQVTALAGTEIRETNIGESDFTLFGYNPETGLTNTSINYSSTPTYQYVAGYSPTSYTTFYYGGYPSQADRKRRFLSYYSNLAYDYKSRYFLSGSVRYDDYNNFGVARKYRATPLWSAGGKWIASRESFMSNIDWISNLGIRATYGVNGNLSLSTYPFTYLGLGGSDYTTGLETASIIATANPELRWEKVYVTNIGLDFSLFKGGLNGTLDYYRKKSKDLMFSYPISSVYVGNIGGGYLTRNIASMKSNGVDFGLEAKLYNDKNWNWKMRFNLSYNTNEITDARFKEDSYVNYYGTYPAGIRLIKGYPTDKLLVYRFAGLDENGLTQVYDENRGIIPSSQTSITSFGVFKDAGRTTAPYFGSFNTTVRYKQFSLYGLMTYQFGSVFLKPSISNYITSAYVVNYDVSADIAKRWKKPGDEKTTDVPGLNGTGNEVYISQMRYSNSDINVLKGDYVRLRQITLSYDLPKELVGKVKMESAQMGLSINNLGLLWTANKEGYDPDFIAYPGYTYSLPAAKSYLFSLNVKF
ncbi:SusC/RagA family TonB-linked outer membrane protein [Prolixibacter bellariivorans]|uniref:SusC/RagA family TonB-linked outer membrane protein n=1 Tax=Prolixibacter bellariivorans TaxID=314319 RepID=A0A5M4B4W9_9BACT|nr:SusC/RagA family TonB-linked outer membrane protein [Prolixibacter bellariivorans]GET35202.1 SusC/RagA family TonB-linked outer membrane protein [Prolixibacter bellariivorans]